MTRTDRLIMARSMNKTGVIETKTKTHLTGGPVGAHGKNTFCIGSDLRRRKKEKGKK